MQAPQRSLAHDDVNATAPKLSILQSGEVAELDAFLARHAQSSMYLRADLRRDTDHANVAIARHDGQIVAAAAQSAVGMVMLQAPAAAGALAGLVLRHSAHKLAGLLGPLDQVQTALHDMGLAAIPLLKNTAEDLLSLPLSELLMPALLEQGSVRCRVAGAADFALLVGWRADFRKAALGNVDGPVLDQTCRTEIGALLPAGNLFILEADQPLACCSFNARLDDVVQIGNVWTPPHLRGNNYARAVVAGALALGREQGLTRAFLSTGRANVAAQAAYCGIGFRLCGDYAMITIAPDTALPDFR